jgi:hypothetical protein
VKKLITATALAAFALATTAAMAEDSKMNAPTNKSAVQEQQETQATDANKMNKMDKTNGAAATTGAAVNPNVKPGESTLPHKPDSTVKDATSSGK